MGKDVAKRTDKATVARTTHQCWSYYRTGAVPSCRACILSKTGRCDQCQPDGEEACPLVLAEQEEFVKGVMALDHIKPEDVHLVAQASRDLAFMLLAYRWLAVVGPVTVTDGQVGIQPIMAMLHKVENRFARLCDSLALSPKGRQAAGLNRLEAIREEITRARMEIIENG